jgi:hypothetical protein
MHGINLLEKLFNTKYHRIQKGGDKETSALIKLVIVVVILFFVYTYFQNKEKDVNKIERHFISDNSNSFVSNALSNRDNGTNNIGVEKVYNSSVDNNNDQMEIIRPPPSVAVGQDLYGVLRNYDYKTYNDPLTPPFKRDDYMIPAHVVDPNRFGLYTRGGPTAFKKMGMLDDPSGNPGDPYKFLTLMGRQKYYNSTQYEYYVVSTNRDENIKFNLDRYKRELFTDDTVTVPQLDNKTYHVTIDKNLDYEYSPYIV